MLFERPVVLPFAIPHSSSSTKDAVLRESILFIMKTTISAKTFFYCLLLSIAVSLLCPISSNAQGGYHSKTMIVTINGTSNLHDWEMKGSNGTSDATFILDKAGKLTAITKLNFIMAVKGLKSEHTGMDNNTYKALKESKNPNMTFVLISATITQTSENNYLLNCHGNLVIAGKTNVTDIKAAGVYNPADRSFMISGVKKMKMTDYGVTPPKALFGTIRTGNDITIGYTVKFAQ
jgi:hypothetical protein